MSLEGLTAAQLLALGGLKQHCSAGLRCVAHGLALPCSLCELEGESGHGVVCDTCGHHFGKGLLEASERACQSAAEFASTGKIAFEADALVAWRRSEAERTVADQFRKTLPKLAKLMDDAETEVLSYMDFPRAHWLQIHSTNPLERLNAEIKRRTNVVGIFPNDAAITRLVGAMLLEQNDEWSLNRRYMQLEGLQSLSDTAPTRVSAIQR